MVITNVTEFFYFLNNNGFAGLHPVFGQFVNCINEFNGICNCNGKQKSEKLSTCYSLYNTSSQILPSFKSQLFAKFSSEAYIQLSNNGTILNTISR